MPVHSGCEIESMQLKRFKRALLLQCAVPVDLDPLDSVLGECNTEMKIDPSDEVVLTTIQLTQCVDNGKESEIVITFLNSALKVHVQSTKEIVSVYTLAR